MILPLLVGCIFYSLKSVSIYEKSGKTEYHDPMIWEMRCPIILLGYLSSGSCKENRPWLSAWLCTASHRRGISSDKVWPKTKFLRQNIGTQFKVHNIKIVVRYSVGQAKFWGILESNSTIKFDPKRNCKTIFGSLGLCFTTTLELRSR